MPMCSTLMYANGPGSDFLVSSVDCRAGFCQVAICSMLLRTCGCNGHVLLYEHLKLYIMYMYLYAFVKC
jgi:hypothetical protein